MQHKGEVDEIDNDNIMTIGEILGVDNWGPIENILKNNPQNEEQEKILEEKEEEVDEIRMYLTSAYNDEHEYGVKNAMANDIIDKITDYFEEGNLVTTDNGTKQWHIEFDLKDLLRDKWDNTEYFEYTDYDGNTLEGILYYYGSLDSLRSTSAYWLYTWLYFYAISIFNGSPMVRSTYIR